MKATVKILQSDYFTKVFKFLLHLKEPKIGIWRQFVMGAIYERKMTLNYNKQTYTHKNYYDAKSRDKSMNICSFVYIEQLNYLWDIFFYNFHVWNDFSNN